jgi:hypothetical protein
VDLRLGIKRIEKMIASDNIERLLQDDMDPHTDGIDGKVQLNKGNTDIMMSRAKR